jgi:hypothetical protein
VVTPEQKIDPYIRSSVVYLTITFEAWLYDTYQDRWLVTNRAGEGISTPVGGQCTGYVVNPEGWIATAGHCVSYKGEGYVGTTVRDAFVDRATEISLSNGYWRGINVTESTVRAYWDKYLRTESSDRTGATGKPDRYVEAWWGANVSGLEAEEGAPARVMEYSEFQQGDAALLKVNEPEMNALLLVPGDTAVDVGTPIGSVGYAGSVQDVTDADYHPSIKTGTISAQKTTGDIPVYEIDAAVSPGMSGGPTVNAEGQVVGTNSFGNRNEPQSFNFVGTSQRILELMATEGVENELSQDSQDLRAGLDAYFAGDKETAVTMLSAVKEAQPSNDIVIDYLERAQALPDPPPPPAQEDTGIPMTWVWVGLAVLLVLLMGVAGFLVYRHRNRTPAPVPAQVPTPPSVPVQSQVIPAPPQEAAVVAATPKDAGEPLGFVAPSTTDTQPITPVVTAEPVCGSCGQQVPAGQKFCGNCGAGMG